MKLKSNIQYLIRTYESLLKTLIIVLIAFLFLRGCFLSSNDPLPNEVQEILDTQYGSCIEQPKVGGVAPGDYGPERVCTELITNVLGPGTITQQNQEDGITEALCIRILIEKPYMTPNEQIPIKIRIASKVAYLQNGQWGVAQDLYTLDSELWDTYNCPGKFDITTIEEWKDEYNSR